MIIINKTKSKTQPFRVIAKGINGEILHSSETFKSKQAAFKNIKALAHQFPLSSLPEEGLLPIKDNTGKKSVFKYLNLLTGTVSNL